MLAAQDVDVKEAWHFFHEQYIQPGKEGKSLRRPSTEDQVIIREKKLFRQVLRTVASHWQPGHDDTLAPSDVVKTMHEYGIMGQGWYLLEILEMLYRVRRLGNSTSQQGEEETRVIVEEQLLSLWSQFFRNCPSKWITKKGNQLKVNTVDGEKISWDGLPDVERINFSKKLGSDAYRFSFRIHRMLSGVPVASVQHLAAAVLFTFDHFATQYCHPYAAPSDQVPYEPFLRLMLKTMHGAQDIDIVASLGISLLEDNEVAIEEIERTSKRLKHVQDRAVLAVAIDDLQVLGSEQVNLTEEQDEKLIGYFHGRIKRQIERHNRGVIDQLWEQAKLAYASIETVSAEGPSNLIPPKIYSAFLFGYRDLEEPERQTMIWNHMLASGMTPTQEQWGLLMSARMKHLNSMEHIWNQMNASGTKPDHQSWCTRISANIYHGHPEHGIQLLYEWGNKWFAEVTKIFKEQNVEMPEMIRLQRDGPTIPRPNTDALTTVITALVQRRGRSNTPGRRLDLIPDAFAWAETFGVKANLWIYNILFRTCLKDGNLQEAMQILAKMQEDSVTPDAYTYYAFADFVFQQASKSAITPEEQYKLLFNILDMLQQRGLEPGPVFFGSMINSLLKRGSDREPSFLAAMMLVRLMLDKNITVPSQIWTMLMTHHFQQSRLLGTLDTNAIDALWKRMNGSPYLGLDAVFYDRMIEGYASFGEVGRAVTMLERMGKEGKRPGWSALSALLNAFVELNMIERAGALVQDVLKGAGLVREGVRGANDARRNPAKERFFETAREAGVFSDVGVDIRSVGQNGAGKEEVLDMPVGVQEDVSGHGGEAAEVEESMGELRDFSEEVQDKSKVVPAWSNWDEVVEAPTQRRRR